MKFTRFLSALSVFVLAFSILNFSIPATGYAQTAAKAVSASSDTGKRLARIEAKLEKRRQELGIPGVSLAIVKDGKVILSRGYGYKDFENKVEMTADTQLAIGSATKAFTALSVLMLQDDGKLSLDDAPRKYLPYFKIANAETNEKIQIRDLLSHSSGLNRTDLAMITGKLNRVELIKVAGDAKPMAGLREKFYYQNIMFTAAGEIVAQVSKMPWEKFVPQRIFAPLGMDNSTMSVREMQESPDYSFGYIYNFDTKATKKLPTRMIDEIAPAGAINSSANDMSKWIRFVLDGGSVDGKSLLSAKGFDEWTKPQMKITPDGKASYGLGWFLQDRKGKKVLQHGGNIDGFNSMVALMPEENLGFVLLTNVSASSLGVEMMEVVWSGILDELRDESAGPDQEKEVGTYLFPQAGFDINIAIEDGKLTMKVPNQPTYTLVKVEGRKYSLGGAPPGYFITFKDDEALLEQPQGNFTLRKKPANSASGPAQAESAKELIGRYSSAANPENTIEIKEVDGKVSLLVGTQPAYALRQKENDVYDYPDLPETYYLKAKRQADGKFTGIALVQPEGEFDFVLVAGSAAEARKLDLSPDELIGKMIEAMGGEKNLLKIKSRMAEFDFDAVHQGVKGFGKSYSKAPGMTYSETTLTALGKNIGWIKEYFDGQKSAEYYSFSEPQESTGKRLEDVKFNNDFYPFLNWKKKFEKAELIKTEKIEGQETYVLAVYPKNASRVIYYVSAETFLPVRRTSVVVSSTSAQQQPVSEVYSDYRKVDGIMMPFKVVTTSTGMGDTIMTVKRVKHNVKIKDSVFTN